ncbi:MAG: nucleoid-associated protein [Cellulosilyticaceae bacterium]
MSIAYQNTIIHVLDLSLSTPILSTDPITLDDETERFVTKHIVKLFENTNASPAIFTEESEVLKWLSQYPDTDFYTLSCLLASKFFNYMTSYTTIPSGDLLFTKLALDGNEFFALLKLNYKEEFTHSIEQGLNGAVTHIIKHKSIFPSSGQKIDEAVLIDCETMELRVLDQSREKYLSLLLDCDSSFSTKEKIAVIEQVASEVIEEYFENPIEALSALKTNIVASISETQTIPIEEVFEKTFGDHEPVIESCRQKIESFGLKDQTIEVTNSATARKYTSHKLKTNTGIELKFPTQLFQNPNYIEFINNPDGTISILLKNIAEIINQ